MVPSMHLRRDFRTRSLGDLNEGLKSASIPLDDFGAFSIRRTQPGGIGRWTKHSLCDSRQITTLSSPDLFRPGEPVATASQPCLAAVRRFLSTSRTLCHSMVAGPFLRQRRYWLFCVSNVLLCMWMGIPYVYLPSSTKQVNLSSDLGAWSVSAMGLSCTVGQVFVGWLSDRRWLKAAYLYGTSIAICGAVVMLIPLATQPAHFISIAVFYGLTISANYALQIVILLLVVDMTNLAPAFGLLQLGQGIATLAGILISGWLIDQQGHYDLSFLLSGGSILISGLLLFTWHLLGDANTRHRRSKQRPHLEPQPR